MLSQLEGLPLELLVGVEALRQLVWRRPRPIRIEEGVDLGEDFF